MRVLSPVINYTQPHRPSIREVEARATPTSTKDIRSAVANAYLRVTGNRASTETLDVLTAQVSHETARGEKMFNYNFGGIKGASPKGSAARYQTHEVIDDQKVKMTDSFRAYASLSEGAIDYVHFLQTKYPTAFQQAEQGDIDGFSAALKKSGYYTASLEDYSKALRCLAKEPVSDKVGTSADANCGTSMPDLDSFGQPALTLSAAELVHVLNAVSSLSRALSRSENEDDFANI